MAVDIAISEPLGGRAPGAHPLDPPTGSEIERAAAIIKASEHATPELRFVMISLQEPPKPPGLTFEKACDNKFGFLRVEVTANALSGEYLITDGFQDPHNAPPAQSFDTFEYRIGGA